MSGRVVAKAQPNRPLRLFEVLKDVRQRAGLSQTQLGRRLGFSATTISAMERGLRPMTYREAEKFAAACGYRIRWRLEPLGVSRETVRK